MKGKIGVALLVGLLALGISGGVWAQTPVSAVLTVTNERCPAVQITQIAWLRDGVPLHVQRFIPGTLIRFGEKRDFRFDLPTAPAMAVVTVMPGDYEVRVPIGKEVQYECGVMLAQVEVPTPPVPPGMAPRPPDLPRELGFLSPGQSPEALFDALRAAGATVEVQGSPDRPKLGDVDDPLLIGVLGPGFQAVVYWVWSGTGQLRSVLLFDRPAAGVALLVVGWPVWPWPWPWWSSWCLSWSPPMGGLHCACDRPGEPFTWSTGPVSGNLFLVVVVKWTGPTMPYVLTFAG